MDILNKYILLSLFVILSCSTQADHSVISKEQVEPYKCLAELHPELTEKHSIVKLGETHTTDEGRKYRVLGECKKVEEDLWLQFLDTNSLPPYELDGVCDFVIQLSLEDGNLYMTNSFTDCAATLKSVLDYCIERELDFDTFVHVAEDEKIY